MSGENPVFSFAHGLEEKPYGCSAVPSTLRPEEGVD